MATPRRFEAIALAAVVLLALVLRVWIGSRAPAELDHLTLIDDSYLALHLARSIAEGLGPMYGMAPTNGFQPAFVFAVVPAFWLWPHDPDAPLRAALALAALFDLGTLIALYHLVRARASTAIAPLAAALVWAVNPYVLRTSLNGLETSIACFMLALLLARLDQAARERTISTVGAVRLGALLGLGALARIDLLLMAPIAALVLARGALRSAASWRSIARAAAAATAALLVVTAPWWIYSWAWTGTLAPISGRAVRYMELAGVGHQPTWSGFYAPMLDAAARAALRWNGWLIVATLMVVTIALIRDHRAGGRAAWRRVCAIAGPAGPGFAFAAVLFLAYAFVIFGHWHFPRYLFPLALPITWTFARAVDALAAPRASTAPGAQRTSPALGAVLVIVTAAVLTFQPPFARLFAPVSGQWGYRAIGEWARGHFPAGTRIGASQSGALGYFADSLQVINLDGVVNRDIYEAMRAGRALDYVRASGVRWLVWQDDIDWLVRETAGASPAAIEFTGEIPGIRTFGEPWGLYRVAEAPAQSSARIAPSGAGPRADTENLDGWRNVLAASVTDSRVTAITRSTSSSIEQNRPR
jgi:hypothetical protein